MMSLLHNIPPEVYRAYFKEIDAAPAASGPVIYAENPRWDANPVLRLSELSVRTLARFFPRYPRAGLSLKGSDRALYQDVLSTKHPIALTAEWIFDESYWSRCCRLQLPSTCRRDVTNHGGSYKRMFLEKHLQNLLETFRPLEMDLYDIKELLATIEPFVKRLEVDTLLTPTIYLVPGENDFEGDDDALSTLSDSKGNNTRTSAGGKSGSPKEPSSPNNEPRSHQQHHDLDDGIGMAPLPEINMRQPANHLDFSTILPSLGELEELRLCYQCQCGINFRWNMFGMTAKDADMLSSGLRCCKKLKRLCIRNSIMDDDKFYAIFDGLRNISKLEELLVPNNVLTDDSIISLVKVLNVNPIRVIDLTNNQIGNEGVNILARYLISGGKIRLQKIVLALNTVGNDGCESLCQALEANRTVQHLDLSSNRLDSSSCEAIARLLKVSKSLIFLNLACNSFGEEGGRIILDGLESNEEIQRLDVRLTGCGKLVDLAIQDKLRINRAKAGVDWPRTESSLLKAAPQQQRSSPQSLSDDSLLDFSRQSVRAK